MAKKKNNSNVKRDSSEYLESLHEQLEFLVNNCKMYDEGNYSYGKQIATNIRVLVHDTRHSTSLLKLLERKDNMKFCSTATFPKKAVYHLGLVNPIERVITNQYGSKEIEHTFIPNLNEGPKKWVDFDTWYNQRILVSAPNSFKRHQMISYVTNKDGGAHVDSELPINYYNISRGIESMLYASNTPLDMNPYQKGKPFKNLHLAVIRQIAHELILSIRKEFGIRPDYNPSMNLITQGKGVEVRELLIVEGDKTEYER